ARLRTIAPELKVIGLSATVADPDALRAWLMPQAGALPRSKPVRSIGAADRQVVRRLKRDPSQPLRDPRAGSNRGQAFQREEENAALALADLVVVQGGAKPDINILASDKRMPW